LEPETLGEIRRRVQKGRWARAASTWVETDKKMPVGESLVPHIQYTRDYLSRLFEIDPDSLDLDFEPDTFGHTENIPEILRRGGIKYYYHCRGYDGHHLYNWEAPSGAQVLVYREPVWYNAEITPYDLNYLPQFCREHKLNTALKVYGVGDHGGGPTRRDVERIRDMMTWPLMPTLRFGTFHDFFNSLEASNYPVVRQELNYVFTGCYTTQSRIKLSNRLAQARMNETEALTALRQTLDGVSPDQAALRAAWEKILFNHFHDILPGSCVVESREYAMGQFQEAMAAINTQGSRAMRALAAKMDTVGLIAIPDTDSFSEGGGVGFGTGPEYGYRYPQTERGSGRERLVHVFNPTQYERKEVTECTIWDYQGDVNRICVTDAAGNPVRSEVKGKTDGYWGHVALHLLIEADVPSYGYQTYIIRENMDPPAVVCDPNPRTDDSADTDIVLENDCIRAVFKRETMQLCGLWDKQSGQCIIDQPACSFERITEDPVRGMSAWQVGDYARIECLNSQYPVMLRSKKITGMRKSVEYSISFDQNVLDVEIRLDEGSKVLDYEVKVRWMETGDAQKGIPQLRFVVPLSCVPETYLYDEACGVIERKHLEHDVPAQSFAAAFLGDEAVVLACDSKYGFRGGRDGMALTLVRSAYEPDPLPEIGDPRSRIGVGVCAARADDCVSTAVRFCQPLPFVFGTVHEGTLPCCQNGPEVCGPVRVSAWKAAENGNGTILRLYSLSDRDETIDVKFNTAVNSLTPVDLSERETAPAVSVQDNHIGLKIGKGELYSFRVQ